VNFEPFCGNTKPVERREASKHMPRVAKMRMLGNKKLEQNKKYGGQKMVKITYCLL